MHPALALALFATAALVGLVGLLAAAPHRARRADQPYLWPACRTVALITALCAAVAALFHP